MRKKKHLNFSDFQNIFLFVEACSLWLGSAFRLQREPRLLYGKIICTVLRLWRDNKDDRLTRKSTHPINALSHDISRRLLGEQRRPAPRVFNTDRLPFLAMLLSFHFCALLLQTLKLPTACLSPFAPQKTRWNKQLSCKAQAQNLPPFVEYFSSRGGEPAKAHNCGWHPCGLRGSAALFKETNAASIICDLACPGRLWHRVWDESASRSNSLDHCPPRLWDQRPSCITNCCLKGPCIRLSTYRIHQLMLVSTLQARNSLSIDWADTAKLPLNLWSCQRHWIFARKFSWLNFWVKTVLLPFKAFSTINFL